jgi:transducin (beta)-like 1
MEIEAHMNEEGELMECNVPFSLLEPHHCELTGNTFNSEPVRTTTITTTTTTIKRQRKDEKKQKEREKRARKESTELDENESIKKVIKEDEEMVESNINNTPPPPTPTTTTEIDLNDVIMLKGHKSEVFSCAWNPITTSLLASGYTHTCFYVWLISNIYLLALEMQQQDCGMFQRIKKRQYNQLYLIIYQT